jgi:hypothetical protein
MFTFSNMHKFLKRFLAQSILAWAIALALIQSCAQMASPPGGKKDTLAPLVIESIPLNKSKNFKGKKVELNFNEYINIKNLNQELLITPNVGTYQTRIRPTGLSILLDSALKPNTTYTFNFRNAIEDISERNIGKNIKLVFSTSNAIDSLQISGQVRHILTNKKLENILIGLYPYSDTLSIDKNKPYYFTKTDTSGTYNLENIASGKYYLAAFNDLNNNLLYNSNKELVDFIAEPFIDLKTNQTQDFNVAIQNLDPLKIVKTTNTVKTVLLDFNRGLANVKFEKCPLVYQIEQNRSIRFYAGNTERRDTLIFQGLLKDSLGRELTQTFRVKFREQAKKEKPRKSVYEFDVFPKMGQLLSPLDSIVIRFQKPVVNFDPKLVFYETGENERSYLPDDAYKWNSLSNELTLNKDYFPIRSKFALSFVKKAFVSVEQDSSETYNQAFEMQDLENYGSISGSLKPVKPLTTYVVQLIHPETKEVLYETNTKKDFTFPFIEPAIYEMRAIEDSNQNGKWDIGNFKKRIKPEAVYFYIPKLKLKANFQLTDLWISTQ